MRVTVAICTWNRAELLELTLTAMHCLRIPPKVEWELLIINNNCTDHTDQVIDRHSARLPIRRLSENQQGLSNARNRAAKEASGDLIVWTDDDVIIDQGWLAAYVEASQRWPEASFFGGTVDPWFSIDPPAWIGRNIGLFSGPYAIAQYGHSVRLLSDVNEMVMGANMAFRRAVYLHDKYDPRLGRMGKALYGGEDVEFCLRLRSKGAIGVWVGTARVRHYIPEERLTRDYIRRWFKADGVTWARAEFAGHFGVPLLFGLPRWAIRILVRSLPGYLAYTLSGGKSGLASYLKVIRFTSHFAEIRRLNRLNNSFVEL